MLSFKKKLLNLLPKKVRRLISKVKLFIKNPRLIFLLGSSFAQSSKPIYIISFPRAGSSWAGSILGSAANARYLREPITTAFFYKKKHSASVFSKAKCEDWSTYSQLITNSLNAQLPTIDKVVAFPEQWYTPNQAKLTIIKEINPLIIRELLELGVEPIYLIRHPFSVAKSYKALGWDKANQFQTRFSEEEMYLLLTKEPSLLEQSYFYQIGFLQGLIEAQSRAMGLSPVIYEHLVENPVLKFSEIFQKLQLSFNENIKELLISSLSLNKDIKPGDFGLIRKQKELCTIKVSKAEYQDFIETIDGYSTGFKLTYPSALPTYSNFIKVSFTEFEVDL